MRSSPPTLRPSLRTLFWPLSRDEFFERHWDRSHFVSHADPRRLSAVERDLGAVDVEALLGSCRSPQAWSRTPDGRHHAIMTRPSDAMKLYASGMTLYLWNVKGLEPWVEGLSREIGAPPGGAGSVFASPAGASVGWHFDRDDLFTIQLRGTKQWSVAPNRHLRSPDDGWSTGSPVPESIRAYCAEELPSEGPPEHETFELRAGSVLYLPRGYWHATQTIEDSLSIEFNLRLVTWADLVLDGVRTMLLAREPWRQRALGAWGDPPSRGGARDQLRSMLSEIELEVTRLRAEDLIELSPGNLSERTPDLSTRYERNALASFAVERSDSSSPTARVSLIARSFGQVRTRSYEMDVRSIGVCRWIAGQSGAFRGEDAILAAGDLSTASLARLLGALVEAGFIRLCDD